MHPNQRQARIEKAKMERKAKAATAANEDQATADTFVCHSYIDDKECGLVFSTRYFLQKHQRQAGRRVSRGRRRK